MLCPKCGKATKVCDTRHDAKENEVYRHHMCGNCGNDFFTIEFEIENNGKFSGIWKVLARGSGSKPGERKL